MAQHHTSPSFELTAPLPDNDYAERKHTYRAFLRVAQYSLGIIVLILALMAIFLT